MKILKIFFSRKLTGKHLSTGPTKLREFFLSNRKLKVENLLPHTSSISEFAFNGIIKVVLFNVFSCVPFEINISLPIKVVKLLKFGKLII